MCIIKRKEEKIPSLSLVVAVDEGWGIGNDGKLLVYVSRDLKQFRALTTGKTVILGSKTLATFPGGKPLKNRRNIILSRREEYTVEGAEVAHSVDEALSLLKDGEEAVVIGGERTYRQFLPLCDTAYVTRFERKFDADAFFPDLDSDGEWILADNGEPLHAEPTDDPPDLTYRFCVYKRVKKSK